MVRISLSSKWAIAATKEVIFKTLEDLGMKEGDKVKVTNNDGGRFFEGAIGEIVTIMNPEKAKKYGDKKYVAVKSLESQTLSWYAPEDLEVIE